MWSVLPTRSKKEKMAMLCPKISTAPQKDPSNEVAVLAMG